MKNIFAKMIYHITRDSRKENALRLNVETALLATGGLHPGDKIRVEFSNSVMRVLKDPEGDKIVSRKVRKTMIVPALDIRGPELQQLFRYKEEVVLTVGTDCVEVTRLEPARLLEISGDIDRPNPPLAQGDKYKVGSCFSGAGILDHAAEATGFFKNEYVLDIDVIGLEVNHKNRPDSLVINGPIQKVPHQWLPPVDVKMTGIPCQHYSSVGKGDDITDENTATVVHHIIRQLAWELPKALVVEEVPRFQGSFAHEKLVRIMEPLGYRCYEDVLDAYDFGSIPMRKRYWGVFVKGDVPFTFPKPQIRKTNREQVKDHLKVPIMEREWIDIRTNATFRYLIEGKKSGWALKTGDNSTQVVGLEATKMRCFTAGYYRMRSEGPFLRHPDNPFLVSLFTPKEIASFLGISPDYNLYGVSRRKVGELLGQSVCVRTAKSILNSLALTLMELDIRATRRLNSAKAKLTQSMTLKNDSSAAERYGQMVLNFTA